MAKIFVTLSWDMSRQAGDLVKAYTKEADAKAAVERSSAARNRFEELWNQLLRPYSCTYCSGREYSELTPYPGKDGEFYDTPAGALYGDKRAEFYALEEVKECRRLNTREDYYEAIELCE